MQKVHANIETYALSHKEQAIPCWVRSPNNYYPFQPYRVDLRR